MKYRRLRERFAVTLRTQSGHQFRGEFGNPNSYPRPRKEIQNLPHRALVTSRGSLASAGDLVTHRGQQYLLCGQHVMGQVKRFLAIEVNETLLWTRFEEVIDPVTKMVRDTTEREIDPALPVVIEPRGDIEEQKFSRERYRVFTHAGVNEGDFLGGRKVLGVSDLWGLKMLDVV